MKYVYIYLIGVFFGLIIGFSTCMVINTFNEQINEPASVGRWTKNCGDFRGDWVHVRVDNISYERAVEVCKHEVGHEIFAEICEKDIDRCFKVVEE